MTLVKMPAFRMICFLTLITVAMTGCTTITLNKREKNISDPADQGTETLLKLRGPRAKIIHNW